MQFKDAAYKVLKTADQPLHYKEIATRAMQQGLLTTSGRTPEATMGALLYTDTLRDDSRFERVGNGRFQLKVKRQTRLVEQIEAVNQETRKKLRELLAKIHPQKFEVLVGSLLQAMGLDEDSIDVTQYSQDRGIDVRGMMKAYGLTEIRVAVQAKRWRGNIGAETVQMLRGAINPALEHGIIITTGDFTRRAKEEANAAGVGQITLINGERLIDLLIQHKVGVGSQQHWVYAVDEDYWGNLLSVDQEEDVIVDPTPPALPTDKVDEVRYPLKIRGTYKEKEFWAEMLDIRGRIRMDGTEYGTPSAAALVTMPGRKAENGWTFWKYQDPVSGEWKEIGSLRN